MASKAEAKKTYKHFVPEAKKVPDWYKNFNFVLVTSMGQLNQIFINSKWEPGKSFIAFDTETTGLDFEELDLVGYSFCIDGKSAYYVPVNHYEYENNLGEPSVKFIYDRMCEANKVFMYNARYDERVIEMVGFKDLSEEDKKKRFNFVKYDMSKVNIYDVMNSVFNADTNIKLPSLKNCFVAGTEILTTNGKKSIENVSCGDKVVLGGKEFNVIESSCSGVRDVIKLEFEDGYKVQCTPDHKFLVRRENELVWVEAEYLTDSDNIVTLGDLRYEELKNIR